MKRCFLSVLVLCGMVNTLLAQSGSISGTVTGPDGLTPLEDIFVQARVWNGSWWDYSEYDWTDASGQYEVGGLSAQNYRLGFSDSDGNYVREYNDNATDVYSADDIAVVVGTTVSNINASLATAGRISGTVTGPDGVTGLQGISVDVLVWNGSWWNYIEWDSTDMDGRYEVGGLPPQNYRLQFSDYDGNYLAEYYDNAPDVYSADDIPVASGATVSNINASLALPSRIRGVVVGPDGVTPLPFINVTAYRGDGTYDWNHQQWTGADGSYEIGMLRADDYAVVAGMYHYEYLGEWYNDVPYVPGEVVPDPSAAVVSVAGGSTVSNINFALDRAGMLNGTVMMGTVPLADVEMEARGLTHSNTYSAVTDDAGDYDIGGMLPDHYVLKAIASGFQDEWWDGAYHRDAATSFLMTNNTERTIDVDLVPGQSPVLLEVTSAPTGAVVYLDYQATTNVTPVVLNMGEEADWVTVSHPYGNYLRRDPAYALRTVTVQKEGRPVPVPREVLGVEAETVSVHFDLTPNETGSLSVATSPQGCEVFVDYADTAVGVSPITVGNLAPGSHTILLRDDAHLRPRPIVAYVQSNLTNEVSIPLVPNGDPGQLSAAVHSVPPGATIYIDYLPTTNVTDIVVDGMDAASHAGDLIQLASHTIALWSSVSHTVMLRKDGYLPSLPRYVPEEPGSPALLVAGLLADAESEIDDDEDGLADQWEDAYELPTLAPTENGPDDDPDNDGATNEEEQRAGTNPMDGDSVFRIPNVDPPADADLFTVTFNSVPGHRYLVLCTGDLADDWVQASGIIEATAYRTSWSTTLTEGAECRFFRVVVLVP